MSQFNLAAFTPPSNPYPPYLSINAVNERIEVTVRSPAGADGSCGRDATISLSFEEFIGVADELASRMQEFAKLPRAESSLRQQVFDALERAKANGFDYSAEEYARETDLSIASDLIDCSNEFDDLQPADLASFVGAWRTQ